MDGLPAPAPTPINALGREIADAASELANRIEMGEFDDLDDDQMTELRQLSSQMAHWAEHARALEKRLALVDGHLPTRGGRAAFCN